MNAPEKVSDAVRALNPHLYATPQPQAMQLPHDFKATKADVKAEKQLQALCQNGLNQRGYIMLTNSSAAQNAGKAIAGWWGHLGNAKQNPFFPDLLIFDAQMRRCLMVELKTHNVFQQGQREMCECGAWKLVTSYDDFVACLQGWEKNGEVVK